MKYKKILFIILILTIIFAMTGCKDNNNSSTIESFEDYGENITKYEPEYGGNLVLPVTSINTLNPLTVKNSSYYHFSKLMFESLFEFDENLNIINQLADSYTFKNSNTVNIKLKDNVFWHDGEKLTAEDVAFTINTIKYAGSDTAYKKMWNTYVGSFNPESLNKFMSAIVIDELSLDIVFDVNFSYRLETLTFPIIPKHRFVDGVEDVKSYEKALVVENYTPIGTGPYKFVAYEKYKEIGLEYFDEYRDGRPYIDKITGKILEDYELALVSFETGQVDLSLAVGEDWEKYDQNNKVKIIEYMSQDYEFLGFNFSNKVFAKYGPSLRKAVAYGIDRQAIVQNVYLGHATQIDVPIHPNSWLISDDANIYGYNIEKAKKELEKIGWKDVDNDGYYEDEEGNDVALSIITNSYNSLRLKTADMIVEDLNELGIRAVKDYPENIPEDLTKEIVEEHWQEIDKTIRDGKYDIALLGWSLSPAPELSFAFHSNQIGKDNFLRYSNESMDKALLNVYSATSSENKLKAYEKLQSIIINELPYISLFFKNQAMLIDSKIKGEIDPTFYDLYRNIEHWYIPKDFQQQTVDND